VAEVTRENQPLRVRLIGRWNLISFEADSGESTGYPLGRDAIGQIVYDAAGNMAVHDATDAVLRPDARLPRPVETGYRFGARLMPVVYAR
jgi:hypothetical protein